MPLDKNTLETMIAESFPDATLKFTDLAGDNDHWALEIISAKFQGKTRIEQHRMVYAALDGKMGGELHALQLKTKASE